MPTDHRVRVQIVANINRAFARAAEAAQRLAGVIRDIGASVEAVAEEHRKARRRAAYHRRVRLPGTPRSKQWRAGTRRTKRYARSSR